MALIVTNPATEETIVHALEGYSDIKNVFGATG
jgi:hypothetical protein